MATSATRGEHVTSTHMVLVVTVLLISFVSLTDCLMCFQCSAKSETEDCINDRAGMANSTTRPFYVKNCTGINNWTRCMIQYASKEGKLIYYLRGCHDGIYFPHDVSSPQFMNLPANNDTTCDVIEKVIVCYQPCNQDFCNGPRLFDEKNCTDPDAEGCGACGVFARNELIILEIVGTLITFVVTRGIMSLGSR